MTADARAMERGTPVLVTVMPRSQPSFLERFARHRAGLIGAGVVLVILVAGALAAFIAPYDPLEATTRIARMGPSPEHWFGTDELGRDIFSRLLYGAGISLRVGILAVTVGLAIGIPLGALSAYAGGATDLIVQRFIDTMQAFPGLLFAILISAAAGPSLEITIAALGVLSVPVKTRLIRAMVLVVKEFAYVEAARAIGCGRLRIVARHILPNSLAPVVIHSSQQFAGTVLLLAGLGFLGLGAQPPAPEWGSMLASGRPHLRSSPHILLFPGLAVSIVVLSLNLVGDALRDALDPKTSGERGTAGR